MILFVDQSFAKKSNFMEVDIRYHQNINSPSVYILLSYLFIS
jgi:hypothetical protein